MLDKLKVAIVLVIIGAISGFLIWGANELTVEGIAENKVEKERGFYREIFNLEDDAVIDFETLILDDTLAEEITIFNASDEVIGYIYKGSETNNYGDIVVLVGVLTDGTISNVIISNTTNTPTFVKTIKDDYLEPFIGQSTDSVVFDSRTGASFTYGSVSKFVEAASLYYQENRGDE